MKRSGYYVEGKHFANRYAQAKARAYFLANEYGRGVDVRRVDPRGQESIETTAMPLVRVYVVA